VLVKQLVHSGSPSTAERTAAGSPHIAQASLTSVSCGRRSLLSDEVMASA
jgi:hypothetical protein